MNQRSEEVRKFLKIAQDLRAKGFRVSVQNTGLYLGKIFYEEKEIHIKEFPSTLGTLWTLLHEYAHQELHHDSQNFQKAPDHVKEFECEQWVLNRFKDYGLDFQHTLAEAQNLLTQRILAEVNWINSRAQWFLFGGLDRRALDFLRPGQRKEIDASYQKKVRPLYPRNGIRNGLQRISPKDTDRLLRRFTPFLRIFGIS
jgi:hypothetical protein